MFSPTRTLSLKFDDGILSVYIYIYIRFRNFVLHTYFPGLGMASTRIQVPTLLSTSRTYAAECPTNDESTSSTSDPHPDDFSPTHPFTYLTPVIPQPPYLEHDDSDEEDLVLTGVRTRALAVRHTQPMTSILSRDSSLPMPRGTGNGECKGKEERTHH